MSKGKENFNSKNNFKKQEITDNDVEPVSGGNIASRWVGKGKEKHKEYTVVKIHKDSWGDTEFNMGGNHKTLEEAQQDSSAIGYDFGKNWDCLFKQQCGEQGWVVEY